MIRLNRDNWIPTVKALNATVRDWYVNAFPTDDLGPMIPSRLTFWDVVGALNIGADIYCFLGDAADSVVRGRIFTRVADLVGCDYDTVYDTWVGI